MEDPRYKGSELKEVFSTPGTCSHCGNDGKPELVGYKGKLDGRYYDLEGKEAALPAWLGNERTSAVVETPVEAQPKGEPKPQLARQGMVTRKALS